MARISAIDARKIDDIVCTIKEGELMTFGEIATQVWGKIHCAPLVGYYISTQRERKNYQWWRVVNGGKHPVADVTAITNLQNEGHTIRNGCIQEKAKVSTS